MLAIRYRLFPADPLRGLALPQIGRGTLDLAAATERHALNLFERGARPGGLLKLNKKLLDGGPDIALDSEGPSIMVEPHRGRDDGQAALRRCQDGRARGAVRRRRVDEAGRTRAGGGLQQGHRRRLASPQ